MTPLDGLFVLNLSLLAVHEMDAVRRREWRLFVFLNRLEDETAHRVFLLLHIPLFWIIFALVGGFAGIDKTVFQVLVDLFLMVHLALHFFFRSQPAYGFENRFSKMIIGGLALLGALHLVLLTWCGTC
jgi:hypothetical protein